MNNTSKIKLINLPQPNSLDDKLDPPLGLMNIAAVLREQGKQVEIIDLAFFPRVDWTEVIGYADIYGMTVFSSSLYLAKIVRDICKTINPNCMVVVGGPHPTSLPYETFEFFDKVVVGEGEYAFNRLIDEDIVRMPLIGSLDDLPLPARDLVNLHAYTRKISGRQATSICTSRGCPYNCAYCCQDVFGRRVRSFSIPRVIEEIKDVIDNHNIKSFVFYDDTFALSRARFYPLCKELKKLDITYRCNGDVRNNSLEDFIILQESGCREINFGVESGSQKILDNIGKGVKVERMKEAIINAKKAGITVKAFLMVGSPGETSETIEETKRFMEEADPDQFTLFQFVPLPGCAIWKDPEKFGIKIINKDFRNYFNLAGNYEGGIVVETEELSADRIYELRQELLTFLKDRGQRGSLQEYYETCIDN